MAQIVIFAPPGEDVSAAEQALKDAGHEVETVEATAANLLHMAIGMIEDGDATSDLDETPPVDEAPAEEPEELPTEDEDVKESLGTCTLNGITVEAFAGNRDRIIATDLQLGKKISYTINESQFSFWSAGSGVVKVPTAVVKTGSGSLVIKDLELAEGDAPRLIVASPALRALFK